jgi:hypothetical protein
MFLGSIARPVRRADNRTAICGPIVYVTLQTSTASYGESFALLYIREHQHEKKHYIYIECKHSSVHERSSKVLVYVQHLIIAERPKQSAVNT